MTNAQRGDKNVLVHGAGTAQLALAAGVLDELEIHLVPVLLGQGRRLFDNLNPEHIELERTRILAWDGVTHMHYRVQRGTNVLPPSFQANGDAPRAGQRLSPWTISTVRPRPHVSPKS